MNVVRFSTNFVRLYLLLTQNTAVLSEWAPKQCRRPPSTDDVRGIDPVTPDQVLGGPPLCFTCRATYPVTLGRVLSPERTAWVPQISRNGPRHSGLSPEWTACVSQFCVTGP